MHTRAPYIASLRVYEPIENFKEFEKKSWATTPGLPKENGDSINEEMTSALVRMILQRSPSGYRDGVHLIDFEGSAYAAPWTTSMRCWNAINEFKSSLPEPIFNLFVPKALVQFFNDEGGFVSPRVPHILTENWKIPPRWFALFAPENKTLSNDSGNLTVRYRRKLESAKKSGLRAHKAVQKAFGQGPVEEELGELMNWLNVFDPDSIIELDYGGLAAMLDRCLTVSGEGGISADSSVWDVQQSIDGLIQGNPSIAGSGYERLVSRWRRVAELESAT
jgi:hypothetical protein